MSKRRSQGLNPSVDVLLFQSSFCQSNNLEYEAIFRRARELNLKVQSVQYGKAAFNHYKEAGPFDRKWVKDALDFWRPSGCIVECGSFDYVLEPSDFGRMPVVYLDRYPTDKDGGIVCVTSDARSIAEKAVRELLGLGYGHYACFAFNVTTAWSSARESEFLRIMRKYGVEPSFSKVRSSRKESSLDFEREVLSLPRPCGVFAVNDVVAEQIALVCEKRGIAIPEEIAIVGVDNDEQICENAPVTLTSVLQDFDSAGVKAVDILSSWLSHPRRKPDSVSFGALEVVRRASTRLPCGDCRIRKGLEYIRLHACGLITVDDVVKVMGCSRRLAYLRFNEVVGHPIADEIGEVRIRQACALLRKGGLQVAEIARRCGYSSDIVFRRAFKSATGDSPRRWQLRKSVAQ